jgi:RimJ/RimL family protein N-acetyltransferase
LILRGKDIDLVSVTARDAEFTLSLRLDRELTRHISRVDQDLQGQLAWIERYLEREQKGEEFYFVIADKSGNRLGTIRLYDFQGDSFCWGSWIIKPGSPPHVSIESALCIYEFAFGKLGFQRSHFDVRKTNARVLAFHARFGARIVREDELDFFFVFEKSAYLASKRKYLKYLAPEQQSEEGWTAGKGRVQP